MDVSALFAAPNTAASATALSFGALAGNGGNAATTGDGLESLDSFNQLLGNFLTVTASDATGPVLAADGTVVVDGEGASVTPALPQGTAALMGAGLLKGIGVGAASGGQVQAGRPVEGRWAQSGLNLLAAGGLAGQEMNQEVISFLNDLSQAITAQGEGTISTPQEITAAPVIESDGTEMLMVLQGGGAPTAAPANANIPVSVPATTVNPPLLNGSSNGTQVIPKGDMTSAPGQLGITLTVAGTGLTSLPTAMVVEETRLPVSSPVIPRALPTAQPAASLAPRGTVVPSSAPVVTAPLMEAVTTPIIPVEDNGILSDVEIKAVTISTEGDEGDGASAIVQTATNVAATAPAMPTPPAPAALQPTPGTAPTTPAPAIVPTGDVQPKAVDIQPSPANTPPVSSATDQPVPVEAAPVVVVAEPGKVAAPPRTINTSTAPAPMRVPVVDDNARANGNASPTLATDDRPAPTQHVPAPALATDKSSIAMVAAADPEIADDKVEAAPAVAVAVELAAPGIADTEAPTVAAATPQAVPITNNPVPSLSATPATARPVDVSQRATAPTVAVPVAPVEAQDVPAAQGQATPMVVAVDAPTVPDAPAVEQSTAGLVTTTVVRQPTATGPMTAPPAEPTPTIPAQNVENAEFAPSRPMTNAAPAASVDADRVAALSVPAELVTEAATKAPAPPMAAVTAPPVEPKQPSVKSAPITPPVSAPQRTIGAKAVTTPIVDAAPQSPSPVVAEMAASVATTDAPADTPSMSGATAVAQDKAPTDAPVVRIVTEPAPKAAAAAAVKPITQPVPSGTTPALTTTEPAVTDPSLSLTDDATAPAESGNPNTTTAAPPRVTVTISRTTTPAAQTPRTQLAPADQVESGLAVGDDATEDVDATNQKMLAPKQLGEESRLAEAQSDIGSQAQSAGQNTNAARQDTLFARAIGVAEDNLLARAVTAAGKGHESNAGGEGGSSADPEKSAEMLDSMTSPAMGGETAKTQNSDFTQSLRQAAAPHRTAYLPPTHQMAMQVQRAIQDGNERLSIRLNPQELGRIDVQLEIGSEGKLRAKVMVENPQTLEMLQKDSKSLEKALQDAGLQTDQDSLSFSLQDSGDQTQQRRDQSGQSGHGTAIASDGGEQEDPAILAQTQLLELGRVDVVV